MHRLLKLLTPEWKEHQLHLHVYIVVPNLIECIHTQCKWVEPMSTSKLLAPPQSHIKAKPAVIVYMNMYLLVDTREIAASHTCTLGSPHSSQICSLSLAHLFHLNRRHSLSQDSAPIGISPPPRSTRRGSLRLGL